MTTPSASDSGSRWSPAPAPASAKRPREPLRDKAFMWFAWPAGKARSRRWPTRSAAPQLWRTSLTTKRCRRWRARLDRVDVLVNNAGGARGLEPVIDADLDHWRWMWETNVLGHAARHSRAAAQADRLRRRPDRHGHLDRRVRDLRQRRRLHLGQARPGRAAPHAARRAVGKTGAAHRDCAGNGEDGILPASGSRATRNAPKVYEGVTPAGRRGHRRGDRVRRVPPVARRPGPDRDPAARPGQRDPEASPAGG